MVKSRVLYDTPDLKPPRPVVERTPQEIASRELAKHGSPRRAARKAGVELKQVAEWMGEPEFLAEVRDLRNVPLMMTCAALTRAGPKAVRILENEMDAIDGQENPRKIRAAKIVLELFKSFADMGNLSLRVAELEEAGLWGVKAEEPPPNYDTPALEGVEDAETDETS